MARCMLLVSLCALLQCARACTLPSPGEKIFEYPEARRDETVVDDYFGTKIADPYRWLEDPDSEETKAFVDAENNITRSFLDSCPVKTLINKRFTELRNYPKYTVPTRSGDRYFFFKNTGLQNQDVLYVQDSLDGDARVFLDPNMLSEDGTVALSDSYFSEDGSAFAYSLSASGSDWVTIHIKDVATGEDYPEVLKNVKFATMSWTKDNKGFFYSRYPEQAGNMDGSENDVNSDEKLYYHRINTPQEQDVVVVEFGVYCGRYLLVYVARDYGNSVLYYVDLSKSSPVGLLPLTQVVHEFQADYGYVTNEGSEFIFRNNRNAPNYRLIKINFNNPSEENWSTFIPEHPSDVLDWAAAVDNDKLVIHYIRDVKSVLQLHSMETGKVLYIFDLDVGSVVDISGGKDQSEIFFQFKSCLTPGIIYHLDFKKQTYVPTVFSEVKVKDFDTTKYEAIQVFYSSKDGTRIPMFIISKKDLPRDGSRPALLYGYGGFGINMQPEFSVSRLVFMELAGGVVAIPNLRGGNEYGERWYEAGRLLNKQNVFDDFIAAAEYLVREGFTRPDLLTMQGGSNGGLLVAACSNQRPELFGAALVQVGVLDMLRFQKFTVGSSWVSDYGSSDNKTQFEYLIKYSPLHNIQPPDNVGRAEYPATLVLTADHDDRVVPLHSLKYIATLQHAVRNSPQRRPLLARIDTDSGHGGGKPTAKIIDEYTDILCFLAQTLGIKFQK